MPDGGQTVSFPRFRRGEYRVDQEGAAVPSHLSRRAAPATAGKRGLLCPAYGRGADRRYSRTQRRPSHLADRAGSLAGRSEPGPGSPGYVTV